MGWLKRMMGLEVEPHGVVALTDENYRREVLDSPVPVLIDAWGQGCGPCKLLEPVVMQLAKDYRGRLKVAEFDVAQAPGIAKRLGISATPTVVYVAKGREVERVVGYRAGHYHREVIEQELLADGAKPG